MQKNDHIIRVIYWLYWAENFTKSRYLDYSTLLNFTKVLSDDRKSASLRSNSFLLKTHIFEGNRMWETGFGAGQLDFDSCWKQIFLAQYHCSQLRYALSWRTCRKQCLSLGRSRHERHINATTESNSDLAKFKIFELSSRPFSVDTCIIAVIILSFSVISQQACQVFRDGLVPGLEVQAAEQEVCSVWFPDETVDSENSFDGLSALVFNG